MNWFCLKNKKTWIISCAFFLFALGNVELGNVGAGEPGQNGEAISYAKSNKVLEGNCAIVCEENSIPKKETAMAFWNRVKDPNIKIAFSAIRNDNPMNMNGTIVSFDFVSVNHGKAYNLHSSAFRAPVSGIYSFKFVVFKRWNKSPVTIALTVSA